MGEYSDILQMLVGNPTPQDQEAQARTMLLQRQASQIGVPDPEAIARARLLAGQAADQNDPEFRAARLRALQAQGAQREGSGYASTAKGDATYGLLPGQIDMNAAKTNSLNAGSGLAAAKTETENALRPGRVEDILSGAFSKRMGGFKSQAQAEDIPLMRPSKIAANEATAGQRNAATNLTNEKTTTEREMRTPLINKAVEDAALKHAQAAKPMPLPRDFTVAEQLRMLGNQRDILQYTAADDPATPGKLAQIDAKIQALTANHGYMPAPAPSAAPPSIAGAPAAGNSAARIAAFRQKYGQKVADYSDDEILKALGGQ